MHRKTAEVISINTPKLHKHPYDKSRTFTYKQTNELTLHWLLEWILRQGIFILLVTLSIQLKVRDNSSLYIVQRGLWVSTSPCCYEPLTKVSINNIKDPPSVKKTSDGEDRINTCTSLCVSECTRAGILSGYK